MWIVKAVRRCLKGGAFLFHVLLRERSASDSLQNGVFCKGLAWHAGGIDCLQRAKAEGHEWLCDLDLVWEHLPPGCYRPSGTPWHRHGVCDGKGWYV